MIRNSHVYKWKYQMTRTATHDINSHENQEMHEIKIKAQRGNSPILFGWGFFSGIGVSLGQAFSFALLLIQVIYLSC